MAAFVLAAIVFADDEDRRDDDRRTPSVDRWTRSRRCSSRRAACSRSALSWGERWRDEHVGEFYALLAAAGAGMVFFVGANDLMTLFLGLEWFSIALYILCAIDSDREPSLEAGLKYLIVGGFGSAVLLFGSALVYGATGELAVRSRSRTRRRPGDDVVHARRASR